MKRALVVKGRLVGPSTVELGEPVTGRTGSVEVLIDEEEEQKRAQDLVSFLRGLPPGTRTKEDIDRQIREERDAWEDR